MPEQLERVSGAELNPDFAAVVIRVAADVLATMFFEEAVPAPCDHAWIPQAISAHIDFDGSHCGQFLLSVTPGTALSIASGFVGLDPEEMTESQTAEVILELANILCGALMSTLWPESSLSLGSPELAGSDHTFADSMHSCFILPEGMVAVSIGLCSETAQV